MSYNPGRVVRTLFLTLTRVLYGPQLAAFVPAIMLCGYWYGGEAILFYMAALVPVGVMISGMLETPKLRRGFHRCRLTKLGLRKDMVQYLNQLSANDANRQNNACLAVAIDDFAAIEKTYGHDAGAKIILKTTRRIEDILRENDLIVRLSGPRFAIAVANMRNADLETLMQLSARIQSIVSEPISIDATKVFLTASIGFNIAGRSASKDGASMLRAAEHALSIAQANGGASIRAFDPTTAGKTRQDKSKLAAEAVEALESGQIKAWFQPQISTDTGLVSGFEALARWHHPKRGPIAPSDFLPALQDADLVSRLGERMLYSVLQAMHNWDKAGLDVPNVAINLSSQELSNPKLADTIRWNLDRFNLAPKRLTIEILEDVIATSENDVIARTIRDLSEMGCGIDLDDFGTGHASIANIRRFAVKRIKIDKSYVRRLDCDRDQQNMVAAILMMAERMGLETLAEGVETIGEHSMLAQLGCNYVQGYSIARPMPFEDCAEWIERHGRKQAEPPAIGRKAG